MRREWFDHPSLRLPTDQQEVDVSGARRPAYWSCGDFAALTGADLERDRPGFAVPVVVQGSAREAAVGVVLRRGPSAWARLSLWHIDEDWFEHGQWMRARVFERRSDLSADGSMFVAFVRGSAGPRHGNADTWVAVSRPPWGPIALSG